MDKKNAYLVVDFGTGNLRVAVMTVDGSVMGISRDDVRYYRDESYPDAIYFKPMEAWQQIMCLSRDALQQAEDVRILAITATSQREGVVILNRHCDSILGMPNIDHRGRQWEGIIEDEKMVYEQTGRHPTSLFSALKIVGFRKKYPDIAIQSVLSISDWIEFMFSGILHYEHSQASETLLYSVPSKLWSETLAGMFDLDRHILPPLVQSATPLGKIKAEVAAALAISQAAIVVVGGADTQLAVLSTDAAKEDMVIVSGTTTPIIKLAGTYITDPKQRTWTGRHVIDGYFMTEANAGVTGLNYQRLKKIFYPNEGYEIIEEELALKDDFQCMAALGSLIAEEKKPLTMGGFIFPVPVTHELSRADFVLATLWDIACSIYENYLSLCTVIPDSSEHIWICGGGVESKKLRKFIAALTGKEIRIKDNFRHASAVGGVLLCNTALLNQQLKENKVETMSPPVNRDYYSSIYHKWKKSRTSLKQAF